MILALRRASIRPTAMSPTGRAVELRWAAVYGSEGDTLKSEHIFFDQMDFLG
jgi:hypothetical protein